MSDSNDWVLCIDQGGHASRALVFDSNGEIKAQAHCDIKTFQPSEDRVEHDPEELIASILDVVNRVVNSLGSDAKSIKLAGLATQRSSIVCWDKHTGKALSPVISWADRRAQDIVQLFECDRDDIYKRTGLFLNAHYGFSKIKWCLQNLREVQVAQKDHKLVIGPLASFILHRILKQQPLLVDPANGSRTLLLNISTAQWDTDLLNRFDIPQSILPTVVSNGFYFGDLETSMGCIPLRVCTGDQSAALFAGGRPESDTVYINAGTGAFLQKISDGDEPEAPLLKSLVYSDERHRMYVTEGTVNGAARALQWYAEQNGFKEFAWSEWISRTRKAPIFINGISGLGSPYWRANFPSYFVGEYDTATGAVAVLESIVFLVVENLKQMQHVEQIEISGGLSNIPEFCQAISDLTGASVRRSAHPESTARGLAWLLLRHLYELPSFLSQAPNRAPINSRSADELEARYQKWRAVMSKALSS